MGADIGTTRCKAAIFDTELNLISVAYKTFPISLSSLTHKGLDPQIAFNIVLNTMKDTIDGLQFRPRNIEGIGFTGQVSTFVPIDSQNKPLTNFIPYFDGRAKAQLQKIKTRVGEETILEINYKKPSMVSIEPKVLWIKDNLPDIYDRTNKFIHLKDYIILQLTDELVTDYSNASCNLSFDIKKGRFSEALLKSVGICPRKMINEIRFSTECVGKLKKELADFLGLQWGIPIIVGGFDDAVAMVGMGIVQSEICGDISGTNTCLDLTIDHIFSDYKMGTQLFCHAIPRKYLLFSGVSLTGYTLDWFKKEFLEGSFLTSQGKIKRKEAEKLIVIPAFEKRGAGIFGLTTNCNKVDLYQALLEGIAFKIREHIELLNKAGFRIRKIRSCGGGAKNKIWGQIKANIVGLPIELMEIDEAGVLGAGLLAGVGIGFYEDIFEAIRNLVRVKCRINFSHKEHKKYNKLFVRYKKLRRMYELSFLDMECI